MCGIAGFVNAEASADPAVGERQLMLLKHRGPDSLGWHADERAFVGQTRLAVIDLVTGDPPITAADGAVGVALNGEIYNFRSLRAQLEAEGHTFRTTGDTEVIAHLAERESPATLASRLDGMFGFAVWDRRAQRLVLGRDRFGKKPLYYYEGIDTFVFGSEIKAVLAHPGVTQRMDEDALPAYLQFGYVPSPRTIFQGVRSVPPGHVLVLDQGKGPRLERYWAPPVPGVDGVDHLELSVEEAAAGVRGHLTEAVRRRLLSDVPLGAFLSGGIDSSAIVALMSQLGAAPVQTFTIGFDDNAGFDERDFARAVANHVGAEHTEFVVSPKAVDLVEELVWHHDQPFGDSSAVPTFLLSQLTRGSVTVALSGDGGDELFSGYERFAAGVVAGRFDRLPTVLRRPTGRALARLSPRAISSRSRKARYLLRPLGAGLPHSYLSWVSYIPEDTVAELIPDPSPWGPELYGDMWRSWEGATVLDRLLALNVRTYLLDDLLPKVDRMSMAHGLEVRSPFLDADLAEFALRLRPEHKARGRSLKHVLKLAVSDLLPEVIIHRGKRGFGVPIDRWFREDLAGYVNAVLGGSDAKLREHVRGDVLDRLLTEHQRGFSDHGAILWTLLTLEIFLRRQGW